MHSFMQDNLDKISAKLLNIFANSLTSLTTISSQRSLTADILIFIINYNGDEILNRNSVKIDVLTHVDRHCDYS